MKVNESNYEILDRVSKITLNNYEIKWFNAEDIDGYIETENLLTMVEYLLCELDALEEKYSDLKDQLQIINYANK